MAGMMSSRSKFVATAALLPPLALVLLWLRPVRFLPRLLGTLGLLALTGGYAALVIWVLIRFTGLEVEWRGGYIPTLTYNKTRADFAALERSRAQSRVSSATTNTFKEQSTAYWTSF